MTASFSAPAPCIGLMSGTSMDGVDGVVLDFTATGPRIQAHAFRPFDDALRAEMLALNQAGDNELHRSALAANQLVVVYSNVVASLLEQTGLAPKSVGAIGAHGQTVRHQPGAFDGVGYTLQLNNPALLAERTGIDVVADFRSRDVAAGGQGAPLVPIFHREVFARPGQFVGVLNIGGISNLTVLPASGPVLGFDCGPGNALMDAWCQRHLGMPYDADGAWAASGKVLPSLLQRFMTETFIHAPPPKSTGRDLFNPAWLQAHLEGFESSRPQDVQATLLAFTADTCALALRQYGAGSQLLIVCGGGALNTALLDALQSRLADVEVTPSGALGIAPQQVEAAAFAWLAHKTLRHETVSQKSITGTRGARVLGAIYPR